MLNKEAEADISSRGFEVSRLPLESSSKTVVVLIETSKMQALGRKMISLADTAALFYEARRSATLPADDTEALPLTWGRMV